MVHVLIIGEAKKGAYKMKIMEVDLQNIALIKLRGKLDIDSVKTVVKKAHDLLDKNRFRVIIDIGKVQTNDVCLISLSNFLNEFKKKEGIIKILPSSRGGLMKIELYKLPMGMSMSVYNTNFH